MAYSLPADLRKETAFKDTVNITDALLTAKIAEADSIINGTIGATYDLPLSETPAIISQLSKKIAGLLMYRDQNLNIEVQPGMRAAEDWKLQMAMLSAIETRSVKLFGADGRELKVGGSAIASGYPDDSSSSASTPDSTGPAFTRSQAGLFSSSRF